MLECTNTGTGVMDLPVCAHIPGYQLRCQEKHTPSARIVAAIEIEETRHLGTEFPEDKYA